MYFYLKTFSYENNYKCQSISHCCFTRLNPKTISYFYFCLPALLGIYRNQNQKEFVILGGQVTSFEVLWKCHFVILSKMCISIWIKVNKWNYLKNPSQEFKNSFCFRFLWISRKTGRQNQKVLILLCHRAVMTTFYYCSSYVHLE